MTAHQKKGLIYFNPPEHSFTISANEVDTTDSVGLHRRHFLHQPQRVM